MAFDPNKVTFFAETDARGKRVRFGIKAKDRQRHVYVIGKTGMGKSTLLENMAVQDIQNGEGMAFIDPHGSAAEVLLNYVPEHRKNDVLYFAPFDTENPVSFNIMEDIGEDKRHLVVSGLMSVFKKIWVDAWSARMEYILSNVLLALLEYPDSTLLGVNRMLSDKAYREMVVANVKDPGVRAFWVDEFAKYNERYMQEAGDAIKNKIGQFTSNPIIRNIIGQPKSSFDIREIMDNQKIMIINLSKGLIGESNANLLGSMITTRIYLAAMSRADLSPEKMKEMPNFYFFVDEFQSFANATFANILSEARKYHLNLTIAHQYITQMEEEVRDAVFGNVGTTIAFRVGPLDAEFLETVFTPQFLAVDIVNLSFAQIYLTLMIDGIGSQPFSAKTLPPIEPPQLSSKDMVIAASRAQFTVKREVAEAMVHKFHEPVVVPKKEPKVILPEKVVADGEQVRAQRPPVPNGNSVTGNGGSYPRSNATTTPSIQRQERPSASLGDTHGRRPEQQRDHKTFSAPKPKDVPKEKIKETHVEDLKSILKRISQNSKETVSTEQEDSRQKNSEVESKVDLKEALHALVAKEVEVDSGTNGANEDKATHSSPVSEIVDVSAPPQEETPKEIERVSPQVASKQHSTGITPKELERMMRVTTSDKPPV